MQNRNLVFHCTEEYVILLLIPHFTHFPFTSVLENFGDENLKVTAKSAYALENVMVWS